MTLEEMRTLKDMLMKRMEVFTERKEEHVQKLLADPNDRNINHQLYFIHNAEKHIDEIWAVIQELKFDIEDITGEPEA